MPEEKSVKWGDKFLVILGIVLVVISITFIFLKDYKNAYTEGITGLIFIIGGLFLKKTTSWKEMPSGIKAIFVYLCVAIVLLLFSSYRNFTAPTFFLGIPIKFPISPFVKLVPIFINLFVLISINMRMWWKFTLGLLSFNFINFVAHAIWILINPIAKLFEVMNRELPNVAPEVLEKASLTTKITISIPMLIGLTISLIIIIYIFKNKDYFNRENITKRAPN